MGELPRDFFVLESNLHVQLGCQLGRLASADLWLLALHENCFEEVFTKEDELLISPSVTGGAAEGLAFVFFTWLTFDIAILVFDFMLGPAR